MELQCELHKSSFLVTLTHAYSSRLGSDSYVAQPRARKDEVTAMSPVTSVSSPITVPLEWRLLLTDTSTVALTLPCADRHSSYRALVSTQLMVSPIGYHFFDSE